ncbi:Bug family tripartite tricarboxylate transporter substrate binding protein [Ramlibacter albus]|uniref:Tripartite tricarboxylate transporter substrate binding protein n=1 Tax=Ramlibacter albus TaxID=2079448 RepID=A0A923S4V0_9BURK|nr:tripartite tricarboxylate transporter substrate binding protein [Ramlibacter albus]MBC5767989.1 tripartite tricarboxylate transporter substrate binding protein [Ramlibacter albus]
MLNRRQAAAAVAAFATAAARAQAPYPSRPVRILVPFGAGGIADLTARAVGDALSKRIEQSVIIDNRPGAGGVVAGEQVARADPDGYTLLLMSNGTAVSANLFKRLPFDAQKDFAPISLIGVFDLAIVVPAQSPIRNIGELFWAAKVKPGKLNIATINVGSTQNLAAELFKSTSGIKVQVVPFNGTPAVITALRSGEVDAAVEILGPVRAQVDAKALRVLATMGEKRNKRLPDVPTVAESGGALAKFNVTSWNGLAAPAKTPREVVQRLSYELRSALSMPDVREKLAQLDVEARASTPEQLAALLASETKRWGAVIERAGIQKQ